jgi:histidinol-phosphate aminotransferase
MSVLSLVREDLRDFAGYRSARSEALRGDVWLNANESAWANPADADGACRRYPDPQPPRLQAALASLYGVGADSLLVGRGSDEAIDLLVRATCMPGRDAVLVTPPVFGMYAVSARLQGAPVVEVPLRDDARGLVPDVAAIVEAAASGPVRLVFLCSPSNPGGAAIAAADIVAIAEASQGRALVVVDEAYAEFSEAPSALALRERFEHLVVLRTLSKAHALAAARIGVAIAAPELVAVLRRCQAPYPVPTPCAGLAVAGLSEAAQQKTRERVAVVVQERARMQQALAGLPGVRRVYPSQANFLLVRFDDAEAAFQALLATGVVVRDQRAAPGLGDALRITIGTPAQNDRVLSALRAVGRAGEPVAAASRGAAA